jgi:hypothetical protein
MTDIIIRPAVALRREVPTDISPNRIEELGEVRRYVDAIDFGALKERLTRGRDMLGNDWSAAQADYFERLYKNWLYLQRRYEGELLPPHIDVEEFWHGHIVDTRAYFAHCDRIFGYYLHHDLENHSAAWEQTQHRHHIEFGEYIYDFGR